MRTLAFLCLLLPSAAATWSIVIVDTRTGEVAVASATCLAGFDLKELSPVIVVGVGAAAAQANVDFSATYRGIIFNELSAGTPLPTILSQLAAADPSHQSRQYGMAVVTGSSLSFTGASCLQFAGDVTGQVGDLHYAIQGNILTGQPVLDEAERAILMTPGDVPEKLMAAMEAAKAMGGDGRCSCGTIPGTTCGSPPPSFTRSADIGYMIVARQGDTDGTCTPAGCATGSYFLDLNIANVPMGAPDVVDELRVRFDAWRASRVGRADHHETTVTFPTRLSPGATATATVTVRDWMGTVLAPGSATITTGVDAASTGTAALGAVVDQGNGTYTFDVTGGSFGSVIVRVRVDDGSGGILVSPATEFDVAAPPCLCGDCDLNGTGPTILDALTAAQIGAGLASPTAPQLTCCDVDASFAVNVLDALVTAQSAAGVLVGITCP